MINKKAVAIATVIIIALLAGITIGYYIKSNEKMEQMQVIKNSINTIQETEEENTPAPADVEIEE